MGERTGGTWWRRGAAEWPEGDGAGIEMRGGRRRGRGLTGALAVAISGLVLYLAWCVLWERSHPASPAARGVKSGDAAARLAAIRELERIGPQDPEVALAGLIEAMADPEEDNRAASAGALVSVVQGIKVGGSDPSLVRTAVESLIGRLEDPQPAVRAVAAQALATIALLWHGGPRHLDLDAIAAAMTRTADDTDDRARAAAVRALGVLADPLAEGPPPRLIAALEDESEAVRATAVHAFAMFHRGLGRWLPTLLKALEAARPERRPAYLSVLQQIRPSRYSKEEAEGMLPALVAALGSRDREARCHVLSSIGELGTDAREVVPALLVILAEPYDGEPTGSPPGSLGSDPAAAAADALAQVAGQWARDKTPRAVPPAPEVVAALMELLGSPIAGRRLAAVEALYSFEPDEAIIDAFIRSSRDRDASVRAAAIRGLDGRAPELRAGVQGAIRLALEDGSPQVRGAAAWAFHSSKTGVEPMVPALIRHAHQDPNREVREACANALGSLEPPAVTAAVVPLYIEAIDRPGSPALLQGCLIGALTRFDAAARGAVPAIARALRAAELERGRKALPLVTAAQGPGPESSRERDAFRDAIERIDLRRNAARALGRLGPGTPAAGDAVSALALALDDPDDGVSQQVVAALVAYGPAAKGSAPSLIRALRQARGKKDRYRIARIVEALGTIDPDAPGAGEAVDFLSGLLDSDDLGPRLFAERTLAVYGTAAAPAVPRLVALTLRPDPRPPEESAWIATALGRIAPGSSGEDQALAVLLEWLREGPGLPAMEAVIGAVGRFGPKAAPARPRLRELAESGDPRIADAARKAMAALGIPR